MSSEAPTGRVARRFWVLSAVIAILGVGLSLGVWRYRALSETRALEAEFLQEAGTLRRATEREIRLFLDVLDSLRVLHTLSARISDEDFEEFVLKGMLHQQRVLGGFGFVRSIPHDQRASLEQEPDASGRPALKLVESDGRGGYAPAAAREQYFALTYQTQPERLGLPAGYDFASWAPAARAIALMETRDGPVLGGVATGGPDGTPPGWYVFSPIYYVALDDVVFPPPGWLVGFVTALFKPSDILDRVLLGVPALRFEIELVERSAPESGRAALRYEHPVRVADREWRFRCRPGPAYPRPRGLRESGLFLAIGLGLTALISWQLATVGRRTRQIERLVHVRTAALREAHERIAQEMNERMRLEDEIHSTAAREQQRVGQDLHDSLGQKLTGALFLSRGLLRQLEQAGRTEQASGRQLHDALKDTVAEVRRMARGLAPVSIGEDGLADALRRLADESRQTFGVACVFRQSGGHPPAGAVAEQLYYIAREAVHNAARHGQPQRIILELAEEDGRWRLVVEDDGRGLPPDAQKKGGLGLRIMRHRAKTVGAQLEIAAGAGGSGTRVICRPSAG
ncbi:MAG TPA: CHASE domain-containing protein [Kiritimatiellia bacterium]|nr:CHASE domain-containing protein [Kiritimatiellia bacterium]HRZ11528.1 CHASE domain-containing protein [Kiritimatiellia bacterium]HSA16921.1 CHASE domain-containing protein [Kiritimatiellia bacterium]